MNYIRHLNAFFFQYVKRDDRLRASHISLYISLFQYWNYNRFRNPFSVGREELLSITGIGSKNTYHRCMKDLHDFGYICYKPSAGKFKKIKVHLVRLDIERKEEELKQLDLFETGNSEEQFQSFLRDEKHVQETGVTVPDLISGQGQNCGSPSPIIGTATVPKPVPVQAQNCDAASPKIDTGTVANLGLYSINNKQVNIEREKKETPSLPGKIFAENVQVHNALNPILPHSPPEEGSGVGPSRMRPASEVHPSTFTRPQITHVLSFFKKNNYPEIEAKKFFNHYQSNGWLIGGSVPMSDWHSSAHKWMLNVQKFDTGNSEKKQNNASSKTYLNHKNFSEPL